MSLLALMWTFFNIGLFTIGGGVVALTLIKQMLVDTSVISAADFYNMIAVSESTPGPLGINMATYVGFHIYGVPGAILATASEAAPSVIIIIIVARILDKVRSSPFFEGAFVHLRPIATALIITAGAHICGAALFSGGKADILALGFFALATVLQLKLKVHPLAVIALGAIFGALIF